MEDFYEFPGMDRDAWERCTSIASAERAVIEAAERFSDSSDMDHRATMELDAAVDALRKAREGR